MITALYEHTILRRKTFFLGPLKSFKNMLIKSILIGLFRPSGRVREKKKKKKRKLCAFLEANCAGQKVNCAGNCAELKNLALNKIFRIPRPC